MTGARSVHGCAATLLRDGAGFLRRSQLRPQVGEASGCVLIAERRDGERAMGMPVGASSVRARDAEH